MPSKKSSWKKGRGKLGPLQPLLGSWQAETDSPMGKLKCTRIFKPILGDKYIELQARWQFAKGVYEETAIYGVNNDKLSFWSFTSDGKRSEGYIADGTDVHPEAIFLKHRCLQGWQGWFTGRPMMAALTGQLNQKQKKAGTGLRCIITMLLRCYDSAFKDSAVHIAPIRSIAPSGSISFVISPIMNNNSTPIKKRMRR